MTDDEMLKALRESPLGERWHIWHDKTWNALPKDRPADPIRCATPQALTDRLNAEPQPTEGSGL